jgi:malonyl CoA-acyl carrier protein transacylase
MSRALLALPGRGAYTAAALGTLAGDPLLATLDDLRAQRGLLPLAELDGAEAFVPSVHLRSANVAPLIYLASLRQAGELVADHEVVAVVGNALGWCAALAVAGALDPADGLLLAQHIGLAQEAPIPDDGPGGLLLYPLADTEWRQIPARTASVAHAIASADDAAWLSIELGPYAVLGGSERGLATLLAELPPITLGGRAYPLRLGMHGPDHTPLAAAARDSLAESLADLSFAAPHTTLIDGQGVRHTPWSADPAELAAYTLGDHLVTTYRFATSLRVALREYAPDQILLPGPGTTLAGIVGGVVVAEGYHAIRDRAAFAAAQAADPPLVVTPLRTG